MERVAKGRAGNALDAGICVAFSVAAMSVLGTIPVFFTVAVMQRYLVRGISMGAVKG